MRASQWHVHDVSNTDDFGRAYDAIALSESESNPWDAFAFSGQFPTGDLPDDVEEKFRLMAIAPALKEVIKDLCCAWINSGGTPDMLAYEQAQRLLFPDLYPEA